VYKPTKHGDANIGEEACLTREGVNKREAKIAVQKLSSA